MKAVAKARFIHQSPRKVRQVLDVVRGKQVEQALNTLHFMPKKAARVIEKTIHSAVANAVNRDGQKVNADNLYVETAFCDEGPRSRRFRARAMGRVNIRQRRSSHLTIIVADKTAKNSEE
ncbi:MAG: 50S ribosomal protein L22 [Candidatus Marinimicrobia bacterium]|nr:50S ribosomal protein L22 [Candidatus Neomarinimicrobiota bacterium]MCF7841049.1 50S ribosomal protein L22 [Candidatus Neomarinimicrobiota bacterium]MCF7903141.1 50S ribosomal protein L22 [Candidatus Neomarinimicrobiota bacterium]